MSKGILQVDRVTGLPSLWDPDGVQAAAMVAMVVAMNFQSLRQQTNAAGVLTWTFPTPYDVGVTPHIEITPEDAAANQTINHKITALSRTAVTVQISKSNQTFVALLNLTISVSVTPPGATWLHIYAKNP